MMSTQDLPNRIDGSHLGVTSADALAGAEQGAARLRELADEYGVTVHACGADLSNPETRATIERVVAKVIEAESRPAP